MTDPTLAAEPPDVVWQALTPARHRAGLSMPALYLRYIGLGGAMSSTQLAGHCASGGVLSPAEHDLAVLALNERFLELDQRERLSYALDDTPR